MRWTSYRVSIRRLLALSVLLVSTRPARCQHRALIDFPDQTEDGSHLPITPEEADILLEALRDYLPAEDDPSTPTANSAGATQPSASWPSSSGSSSSSTGADISVSDREINYGAHEAAIRAALAAYANELTQDTSAQHTPLYPAPSRGLLEQLLVPQQPSGSPRPDVSSLFGALLNNQAAGTGAGSPLAALLQKPTSTTAQPTRIFDKYVIKDGNPFATQRPSGTTQVQAVVGGTTPPSEVDKFDQGFQIFSQIFNGGGPPEPGSVIGGGGVDSAAFPSLNSGTLGTGGLVATTAPPPTTTPRPRPPPVTTTRRTTVAATTAPPLSWPFYTKPTRGTTSRPLPTKNTFSNIINNFNSNNNNVDKVDLNPVRPTNVPFYYNIYQTAAPPTPPPQINLGVFLGSMTQLVKSDGPSMLAAMYDAATYIQEGNVMGIIQGVIPVFSRATPAFMNMIHSVAPVIEKSDFYEGPDVTGPYDFGGFGSLFDSFSGLLGRRRPPRFRRPANKQGSTSIFSRPYYLGQVMGSGLKLVTYLINHGTTVVRARKPDDATSEEQESTWLQETVGEHNVEYLREWLGQRKRRTQTGRS